MGFRSRLGLRTPTRLWRELEATMAYHAGIHDTPLLVFNIYSQHAALRLGYKHIRDWLDRRTCSIRKEIWPTAKLTAIDRDHPRIKPRSETAPIILIELNGVFKFIDGNTRVNKWNAEQVAREHEVLIVRYNGRLSLRNPPSRAPRWLRSRSAPESGR